MSPIRKILNKIAGLDSGEESATVLHGFGKLPSSREFVHIEAGSGLGKSFQSWIKQGHEQWVTAMGSAKRGKTIPCRLFCSVSESRDHRILAYVWPSRDSASPPRAFPFTFFVTPDDAFSFDWPEQFSKCDEAWQQLSQLFQTVFDMRMPLQDYRDLHIRIDHDASRLKCEDYIKQAKAISLEQWLHDMAAACRCSNHNELLSKWDVLVDNWKQQVQQNGIGIRFPLSRRFAYEPQCICWLQWLRPRLGSPTTIQSMFVPANVPEAEPSFAITTREPLPSDFQLATTDAAAYHAIDDIPQICASMETSKSVDGAPVPTEATLWDWTSS